MKKIILLILFLAPYIAFAELNFNLEDLLLEQTAPNITIKNIDLVWSADTYTPLNYEGRKLPAIGSEVTVETIVSASGGNPSTLKYSWFVEDIFQRNKSGYGKNKFSFYVQQRPGAKHNIKVQIFNDDRTIFEQRTITIPVVKPEIVVYNASDQTNKSFTIATDQKSSFVAKPYFFSAKKLTDIAFEWIFSGREPIKSSDYRASILDLTVSGNGKTGQVVENDLRVSATCIEDPRQQASKSVKVKIY